MARQLEVQAGVIEQKEQAYERLQTTYDSYLANRKGDIELGKAIDDLPEVENIEQIQSEINETESDLLEVITE